MHKFIVAKTFNENKKSKCEQIGFSKRHMFEFEVRSVTKVILAKTSNLTRGSEYDKLFVAETFN